MLPLFARRLTFHNDDHPVTACVLGARPFDRVGPRKAGKRRTTGVRLDRPGRGIHSRTAHPDVVHSGSSQPEDARAVKRLISLTHIRRTVKRIVGVCVVDVLTEVLMGRPEPEIDIRDDHAIAVVLQPGLIEPASEDVPLILEAGLWIGHQLIGHAGQRIADHGLWHDGRWRYDGNRQGRFDFGDLAQPRRRGLHVCVFSKSEREKIAQIRQVRKIGGRCAV